MHYLILLLALVSSAWSDTTKVDILAAKEQVCSKHTREDDLAILAGDRSETSADKQYVLVYHTDTNKAGGITVKVLCNFDYDS